MTLRYANQKQLTEQNDVNKEDLSNRKNKNKPINKDRRYNMYRISKRANGLAITVLWRIRNNPSSLCKLNIC